MRFGNSIMALVADRSFRRNLGTGKSLSFVGTLIGRLRASDFIARPKKHLAVELYINRLPRLYIIYRLIWLLILFYIRL